MSVPLKDICDLIVDCPHSTAPDEGEGYPLIRTPNIGAGYLDLNGVHRVSKDTYDARNARAVPQGMDLILAREAPAGNVGIVPDGEKVCLGQRTVLIRPNRTKVDPWYLNYYLNAPEQRHRLLSNANGATVSHVNMPVIRSLPVSLPSLEKQRRIAGVLAAYDKLIENNRKQIALLEEAAQRLYKEWFCDLRFPGHESTPIHDGLPEGWRLDVVGSVCSICGGGTPSTKEPSYWENGDVPWVTPKELTSLEGVYLEHTERYITKEGLIHSSANLVPAGTILMSSRATIGQFCLCEMPVCSNQGFILCQPADNLWQHYLLRNLMSRIDEMKRLAKGSTFLELGRATFKAMSLVLPPEDVLRQFQDACAGFYSQEVLLSKQSTAAREARDRLLPRLMSGEIQV